MTDTGIEPAAELTANLDSMTADQAVKLVRELCAQLQGERVEFHGNIWPGNVHISADGRAVLGTGSDAPVSAREAAQVEYVAPEYFWDNSGTGASDVYSLGMLLYAGCNEGFLPFQPKGGALTDKDRSGALRKRMKGEELRVPGNISEGLQSVIRTALAYEPEERYASASELLAALSETDEALPSGEPEPTSALDEFFVAETEAVPAPTPAEPVDEDLAWLQDDEQTAAPDRADESKYSVRKDFENNRRKSAPSAAPATRRRKKKTSPAIPILCVAAAAIIGFAVYLGLSQGEIFKRSETAEDTTVSDPFVAETEAPVATTIPAPEEEEATPAPEATAEPEPEEEEETPAPTGSSSIDGQAVTAASDTVYVTGSGTNLRSGPSTTYEIAETLTRGTKLVRTGTVNGWSQVQYEGEEYYVSTSLVSTTDPLGRDENKTESLDDSKSDSTKADNAKTDDGATADAATAVNLGVTVKPVSDTVTVSARANLRSGPSTDNAIVATVNAGTKLDRTGITGNWSRVDYSGKTVYIHNNMINAGSTGTSTATATAQTPATGTATTTTAPTAGGTTTTTAPAATTPKKSLMDELAEKGTTSDAAGTLKVVSDVNVRSGASTDDSVLGIVKAGNTLTVTGVKDGKWYRVAYDGKEGYVNRKLISLQDFTLVSSDSGTLKITTRANVRSGPGTGYDILGVEEVGSTLTVTGKTESGWYQVSYDGKTGYIAQNLVTKS